MVPAFGSVDGAKNTPDDVQMIEGAALAQEWRSLAD